MANFVPLASDFYEPSAEAVAPRLLGHWLIRRTAKGFCGGPIVETEAYLGDTDPASHAFRGKTARNQAMFGPGGRAYVYFIYGSYFCVNAVCRGAGLAEAVLIRAIEADFGKDLMLAHRPVTKTVLLTNGPGKLCAALGIDRKLDGANLCDTQGGLFVAINPEVEVFRKERGPFVTTTRVGLSKAADWHLRFYLGGSPFISKPARPPSSRSTARRAANSRARTKC